MPKPTKPRKFYVPYGFHLINEGSAKNFYLAWRGAGQRTPRRSLHTADKAEAERLRPYYEQIITAECQGIPLAKDEIFVAAVLAKYHSENAAGHASQTASNWAYSRLMAWYDGKYVSEVKAANVQFETDMRKHGLADASINRLRSYLIAAMKHAVEGDLLTDIPKVKRLKPPPSTADYLTKHQLLRLLRVCRKDKYYHVRLFILIGYFTAARREAILSLTWDQIDFEKNMIDFRRRNKNGALLPENKKRRPYVAMGRKLRRLLQIAHGIEKAKAEKEGRPVMKNVVYYLGEPIKSIYNAFRAAGKRAGLAKQLSHPHILKHTSITLRLKEGAYPWDVSNETATSLEMIQKVYGHHIKDHANTTSNFL
jgi:integrase